MFRSISWQLQISYGSLVLIALIGLGVFGYLHQKSEMLRGIDNGLQSRAKRLNSILVRHAFVEAERRVNESSESVPELPRPFDAPMRDEIDATARHYQIWRVNRDLKRLVFQSANAPEATEDIPHPNEIPRTGIARMHGERRQLLSRAQRNHVILVEVDTTDERSRLGKFVAQMVLWEVAFLALFVLAGFYLSKRALKPIERISDTARIIAEGTIDERITVEGGTSELEDLSHVLNDTFDRLEGSILRQQQFTSNASHELRTPITAILAEGQSRPNTIEEYNRSLENCVNAARSMRKLVDQLLELARLDNQDGAFEREATDLDILVRDVARGVQPLADEKSIGIETSLDLIQAEVNSVRITQVLNNLVNNAISYTGEGGKIEIRLSESDDEIEIAVRDTGIGIAAEDLPNIFSRFYRADKSRSDHQKDHFGLGLAISREIAVAHGGDLRVESEIGKGSTFTLFLPKGDESLAR
ncbi:MAG: ATP-binding protein [Verrucomicrobiota bacterium]